MKPADDSQIVFRRIRGRIVPIRKKRDNSSQNTAKNVGMIVAGTGLAVATGVLTAKFSRAPAYARIFTKKVARSLTEAKAAPLFHQRRYKIASILRPKGELAMFKGISAVGRGADKFKTPLFWAGSIGAGALINAGVDNSLSKERRKNNVFERFTAIEMGTLGITGAAFLRSFPKPPSIAKAFMSAFDIVRKARK